MGRPPIIALGRPLAGARVTWAGLLALGGEAPARRGPGHRPAGSWSGAVAFSMAAVTACWRTARSSGGKEVSMHRSGSRGGPGRASARWTPRRCRPRPGWSTSTGTRRRRPSRRRSSRRACAPARESPGRPARDRAGGPSTPRRRRCARAALGTASVPLAWPQCGTEASVPPGLRRCPGGARFGIFMAMPLLNESAFESPVDRCRLLSGCTASSRVRADRGRRCARDHRPVCPACLIRLFRLAAGAG